MTLREQLAQQRVEVRAHVSPFFSTSDHVIGLQIEDSTGDGWVLPWATFLSSRRHGMGDRDLLVLKFVAHVVTIRGVNVSSLLKIVANQQLEWLRAAPEKYVKAANDDVYIDRIDVRPPEQPAEGQ